MDNHKPEETIAKSKPEPSQPWLTRLPKWINDGASFIAALLGILIAWQTFNLNTEIDRLNESLEASTLIGDLIGSLTSEDLKQDIALLTLDYALTSDPNEDNEEREYRHKKLVAEIAASLLNNRQLSVEDGSDAIARSRQIEQEARTIIKILKRLAEEGKDLAPEKKLEYQKIAAAAIQQYEDSVKRSEAPTDKAQAQLIYDETTPGNSEDVVIPQIEEKGETELTSLQSLELATAAVSVSAVAEGTEGSENKQGIIYLHYDNADLKESMDTLKATLGNDWFITDQIQLVGANAFNCSIDSNIRFFHEEDETLARELRTQISNRPPRNLRSHLNDVKLINLSNWSRASVVPKQQLELWVISQGEDCRESRLKQVKETP